METERIGRERVKAYNHYDLAFGLNVDAAIKFLKNHKSNIVCKNINDAIELYNIDQILHDHLIRPECLIDVQDQLRDLKNIYCRFFSQINDDSILAYYEDIEPQYIDDFWEIVEHYKIYKKISDKEIKKILAIYHISALRYILQHKKLVEVYNNQLSYYMRDAPHSVEFLIKEFIEKESINSPTYYLPNGLNQTDYDSIILKYLDLDDANLNFICALYNAKPSGRFAISDEIKYKLKQKKEEIETTHFKPENVIQYKMTVGIRKQSQIVEYRNARNLDLEIYFDQNWLEKYLDYPTILNNFIFVFNFIDWQGRSELIKKTGEESTLLNLLRINGKDEYNLGFVQKNKLMTYLYFMQAYYDFLRQRGILLEDLISWFFTNYLKEEFNVTGFMLNLDVGAHNSMLSHIKQILPEIERALRQYNLYIREGKIDPNLLAISSTPIRISETKSLLKNKYVYTDSENIKKECFLLFSDQPTLNFIVEPDDNQKIKIREDNFYNLLVHHPVYLKDYPEFQHVKLQYLKNTGSILIAPDGKITINTIRCRILKEIYQSNVINSYYFKHSSTLYPYLCQMVEKGELKYDDSLFCEPERDFLNYLLNRSQFGDGLDLRNRYVHGTYLQDENIQREDYMIILTVFILIVLKINEEFCLKYPSEDSIIWCD